MNAPSRRERFRPLELVGLSAGVAVFVGVIVFISTRGLEPTLVAAGIGFIVTLVVLAMLALTGAPSGDEQRDIDAQVHRDTRTERGGPDGAANGARAVDLDGPPARDGSPGRPH